MCEKYDLLQRESQLTSISSSIHPSPNTLTAYIAPNVRGSAEAHYSYSTILPFLLEPNPEIENMIHSMRFSLLETNRNLMEQDLANTEYTWVQHCRLFPSDCSWLPCTIFNYWFYCHSIMITPFMLLKRTFIAFNFDLLSHNRFIFEDMKVTPPIATNDSLSHVMIFLSNSGSSVSRPWFQEKCFSVVLQVLSNVFRNDFCKQLCLIHHAKFVLQSLSLSVYYINDHAKVQM